MVSSFRIAGVFVLALFAAACAGGADPPPETASITSPATTRTPIATTSAPQAPSPTGALVTLPPGAAVCDGFAEITSEGALSDPDLSEISGVVASRRHPGVLWAHNDSRAGATVYGLSTDGTLLATWELADVAALDWEDIAAGRADTGDDYLYVGDIGDNFALRSEITVYRFAEPAVSNDGAITEFETFRLIYPDPGPNAEALAVDPVTGDLLVVTKDRNGPALVFRAPSAELRDGLTSQLDLIATLDLGNRAEVTAADFSPNGDRLAMRGYREVWIWPRLDADLTETLAASPCLAASPDEVQGEAMAFDASGLRLYTISEGTGAAVNRIGIHP